MTSSDHQEANKKFAWIPLLILGLLALINLATGTRYPTAWQDEVLYTDPAANLYFGHGFTSAAWPGQAYGHFWAGNVPLHQFILTGWFHLFGFGLLPARSLNYLLITIAAIVFWRAWQKIGLVRAPIFSAIALILMLCGTGLMLSYRSARPDCIAILLASFAFFATTLDSSRLRRMALLVVGSLFPIAGIQLVLFAFLFCGLLVVFTRKRFFTDFIFLGIGIAIGGGLLVILYKSQGVLDQFILGVTKYSNIGIPTTTASQRLRTLVSVLAGDKSQAGLVMVAAFLLVIRQARLVQFAPAGLIFAIIAWLVVITTMLILGKFPVYYSWMTSIPLAICLASVFEEIRREAPRPALLYLAVSGALACSSLGLPLKMVTTALRWQTRDVSALDNYVRSNAVATGWYLSDYQSYFSLKNSTNLVMAFPYLETASALEKNNIQTAIIQPSQMGRLTNSINGVWTPDSEPFSRKWRVLDSPNARLSQMASRLMNNPQDADWQLEVYRRTPVSE